MFNVQDKLYHQLRMVDAEALEARARKLESLAFTANSQDIREMLGKQARKLYERATAIRKSLEPKG